MKEDETTTMMIGGWYNVRKEKEEALTRQGKAWPVHD